MSNASDFLIDNGVILGYNGTDEDVVIPEGVKEIGSYAFLNNANIRSIFLPVGLETVQNGAFRNCTHLIRVCIPQSVTEIKDGAFSNCSDLEEVLLPQNEVALGNGVFDGCTGLKQLVIPEGIRKLGNWALRGIEHLESVCIASTVTYISSSAFSDCSEIKSFSVSDENNDYYSKDGVLFNKEMTNLIAFPPNRSGEYSIPDTVRTISYGAFRNCKGLTKIVLNAGLTSIEGEAFSGCSNLTEIRLPDSLTHIGQNAFAKCDEIKKVYIPAGVEHIGEYGNDVFGHKLEEITVDPANKKYTTVDGLLYSNKGKNLLYCPAAKKGRICLPNKLAAINANAFRNCAELTVIQIPESVKKIGSSAFNGCTSLTGISLPAQMKEIKDSTFENCRALESAVLPEGLVLIEGSAFSGCVSLGQIVIPASVYKMGTHIFSPNTAVICTADLFKKFPAENKASTVQAFLTDSALFSEEQTEVMTVFIKKNRMDVLSGVMQSGNMDALKNFLSLLPARKKQMAEYLDAADRAGNVEAKAVMLECSKKGK